MRPLSAIRASRSYVAAPARDLLDQRVNHHVAGTGVEREDIRGLCAAGNHRDVGDAADIERSAAFFRIAVEQIIDKRHERRALSARSHIGGTKIAYGRDARSFGNHVDFADLQRGGRTHLALKARGGAEMKDCLPVGADQ